MQAKVGDVWFRLREWQTCSVDEYDRVYSNALEIKSDTFYVTRVTPKGVWLRNTVYGVPYEWKRSNMDVLCLVGARRRYACPTFEEARVSFLAKKAKQLRILNNRIDRTEYAIHLAEKLKCNTSA